MKCKYSNVHAVTIITISLFLLFVNINKIDSIYAQTTPTIQDFNFGSVGDWGCNSNTVNTVNSIQNQNPQLVLGLGDYSYQSTADCWLDRVDPIDEKMKIAIGNHENSASDEDLNSYLNHFGMTSQYYSFDYQNVHFLSMATEISYSSGSAQNLFVKNDLASAAANPNIDWIVVYFHKPMYSSPNSCSSCSGESNLRDIYHPIFDQYGVDIVLEGHTHDYQRSFPIKFNPNSKSNPIITNNNINNYNDPEGQIYAIVGTGGINFHSLSGQSSFIASQQSTRFGHLNIDIVNNGTTLIGKFISNEGGIIDQFTINKSDAPTPPPPSSGYHYEPFLTVNSHNDVVSIPSTQSLKLSKFSVAAWFKTISNFGSEASIVNKGGFGTDSSGNNMNYGIWMTSSEKVEGGFETSSGSNRYAISPSSFNNGQWHHGVVTFDGSIVKLYIDGVQVGTRTTASSPETSGNHPLKIGANSRTVSNLFTGSIDEVGIWNRALTNIQIANLKNNGVVFSTNGLVYSNSFDGSSTPPPPPPPASNKLIPISVVASSDDLGKEAPKAADGNFETRWSANGNGEWIEFTFNGIYPITKVGLTGYHYDKTYYFEINGKQFVNSANRPLNTLIEYDLSDLNIQSNKVKIIGHGNSGSTYNSYREIQFYTQ
jgi:predicted phosphodiesterase